MLHPSAHNLWRKGKVKKWQHTFVQIGGREVRALKVCGRRPLTADRLDSAPDGVDGVTDIHGD